MTKEDVRLAFHAGFLIGANGAAKAVSNFFGRDVGDFEPGPETPAIINGYFDKYERALERCPFCKGTAERLAAVGETWVLCGECKASGKAFPEDRAQECVDHWNSHREQWDKLRAFVDKNRTWARLQGSEDVWEIYNSLIDKMNALERIPEPELPKVERNE